MTYIVFDRHANDSDTFDNIDDAMTNARERISDYQDEIWPDEMDGAIIVAEVISESEKANVVTRDMLDKNGCCNGLHYSGSEVDYWCDYVMPEPAAVYRCNICGGKVQFDGTPPVAACNDDD